ncbi:MAG: tripartite tricarboxylate transporter TctB family protein [Mailhella sp.]|nr:tripartite tricarboxylate transporter TctB family protein [Mailhella sp.]
MKRIPLPARSLPRVLLFLAGALAVFAAPPAFEGGMPSAGLWPLICGCGLMLSALLFPASPASHEATVQNRKAARDAILVALAWILLLPLLGWGVTSLLCGFTACRRAGCSKREALLLTILLCSLLWLGMEHALNVSLPRGKLAGALMEIL